MVQWSAVTWAAVLYLALAASVCAFWLNYWLLERMDASAMLMMGVLISGIAGSHGAPKGHSAVPCRFPAAV